MVVDLIPSKLLEIMYSEYEINEESLKESIKKLREWLRMQPHLPFFDDEKRLLRMFIQCKGRMEVTKSSLDMYFSIRGKIPEVFGNRDPFAAWFKKIAEKVFFIQIPYHTEDFCRINIIGALNPPMPVNDFDPLELLKLASVIQDIRLAEDFYYADIYILDLQGGSAAHASKITIPLLRKLRLSALKGYKVRVKQVHLLNVAPIMDTVINFSLQFARPEHRHRLITHRENIAKGYDSLHKYVSPKLLPREYGGEAGSITDMWDEWKKKICSYREWFINEGAVTVDESKRTGKPLDTGELFGFEGSFRQLQVD
ncbi:alpha-tocopherol transfer protein-like [Periplaneta americana]|uniref:alpha-tocopherol transfer protein-like n=1 Tax=Periplaneta americana TaxID=6978 RepID=UPI0037E7BB5F